MIEIIKKALHFLRIFLLVFIILIVMYFLAAFIFSRIEIKAEPGKFNDVSIFLINNGVHTDIMVPVRNSQINWSKEVKFVNTLKKDSMMNYLAFGWGEKEFYMQTPTWADLKFSVAFKSVFWFNSCAIHTTFYKDTSETEQCIKINLSREQYNRLIKYIWNSFSKDQNGHTRLISKISYGNNDAFYEATGLYSMLRTCNTWTNTGLKTCGQKACFWTPFSGGVIYHYSKKGGVFMDNIKFNFIFAPDLIINYLARW